MSKRAVTHDGARWSNAEEDRVTISEYNPVWPSRYAKEARAIRDAIDGEINLEIEHFGSTAVAGMAAKPVIDILLIVPDQQMWPRLIAPLEGLDYAYWSDNPRTDRMFFVKGMPPYGERRTHHVHVRRPEDAEKALIFRDYLRSHPQEARRYEQLKRELSKRYPTDREAYTEKKGAIVAEMLESARKEDAV